MLYARRGLIRALDCFLCGDNIVMKDLLDTATEIDFVTCGIKPKGELYLRASKLLEDFDKRKARPSRKKDFPVEAAFGLVEKYVGCHEYLFKPHRVDVE